MLSSKKENDGRQRGEKEEEVQLPMDIQSLEKLELGEEEATPTETKQVLPGSTEEQTPSMMGLLGVMEPQEDVAVWR